jgi:hypothetical protein
MDGSGNRRDFSDKCADVSAMTQLQEAIAFAGAPVVMAD